MKLTELMSEIPKLPWSPYATSKEIRQDRLMDKYKTHAANVLPELVHELNRLLGCVGEVDVEIIRDVLDRVQEVKTE